MAAPARLMDAARSRLLVVDVQERLVPAIDGGADVVANVAWLLDLARRLGVPVAAVAQYPKGLGPIVPEVASRLPLGSFAEKTHFSAVAAGCLPALPGHDRPQVVVAGVEAHVCVLQTALGLVAEGREVYVVADAVGSRRAADKALGLERMRARGVDVVSREMVAFEWLGQAGSDAFRAVSRELLR